MSSVERELRNPLAHRLSMVALIALSMVARADDVSDALGKSSFAGVVRIHAGDVMPYRNSDHTNCGAGYTAYASAKRVFVNDIGWIEGYPIEFRAANTLDLGGTYLIFLNEVAIEDDSAHFMGSDVRSDRCMRGGISLVPVLLETESTNFDAVFQKWRIFESANIREGIQYRTYFLAHREMEEFFRLSGDADHQPLESIPLEIQRSYGSTKLDAYVSDDVLKMVADDACSLRDSPTDSTSELRIAKCPQ